MTKHGICIILGLVSVLAFTNCVNGFAQTFEMAGLKSGMTPEQVTQAVPMYDLRWMSRQEPGKGSAFLVQQSNVYANLFFCKNALVAVSRSIDLDTEFVDQLADHLRDFGQPEVKIRSEAWTGPGGW